MIDRQELRTTPELSTIKMPRPENPALRKADPDDFNRSSDPGK